MAAAERKIILVLDLYDLVKRVRKQTKVQAKLDFRDPRWEHPCDIALKDYVICDHTENVRKEMQFRINATLLKSDLEVKHQSALSEAAQSEGTESVQSARTALTNTYSVSSHFKNAERNSKRETFERSSTDAHKDQTVANIGNSCCSDERGFTRHRDSKQVAVI